MEERVARLRLDLEVEPVAEVGRILGEDAVAEEAEDRRVLALQLELELGLELVELVEMTHGEDCSGEEELLHRPAARHDERRIELRERLERERPLVQARMRKLEARLGDDEVVHQQEIEVDRPRPVALARARRAELLLDLEQGGEERRRRQGGVERDRRVEEPGLVEEPHRIGLAERRDRDDGRSPGARRAARSRA